MPHYYCEICGSFLRLGSRRDARYCSAGCRVKADRQRKNLKRMAKSALNAIRHLQAEQENHDFVPALLNELAAALAAGAAKCNKSTDTATLEINHEQN